MIKLFKDNEITEDEFLRKFDNNEVIFSEKEYQLVDGFGTENNKHINFDFSDFAISKNITFSVITNINSRCFVIVFIANYCSDIVTCNHISIMEAVE